MRMKEKRQTIRSMVEQILHMAEDILDCMKGRFGKDKPVVRLKGTRKSQFDEVVRLKRERPSLSLWRASWLACRAVTGTEKDRGYTDWRSLYRYANKKRDCMD